MREGWGLGSWFGQSKQNCGTIYSEAIVSSILAPFQVYKIHAYQGRLRPALN